MTDSPTPTAPESLPKYLAEGMKQDDSTLKDTQEYAQALIQYREQAVDPAELPETADPGDVGEQHRTVVLETVRCGDDSCHCSEPDGERHGPSLSRYQSDGGSLDSESLGNPEIETT
jgi:hypothetical protein